MDKLIYKVITKEAAKEQGLKRYFTGKPCQKGHVCERLTSTGHCYECARDWWQASAKREPGKYKKWYHSSDENHRKGLIAAARNRARKRKIPFDITFADIKIPERCPALNIPLFSSSDGRYTDNSPTIDRIDSNKGYTKDNVVVVSWRANRIKNNATPEELKLLAEFYFATLYR